MSLIVQRSAACNQKTSLLSVLSRSQTPISHNSFTSLTSSYKTHWCPFQATSDTEWGTSTSNANPVRQIVRGQYTGHILYDKLISPKGLKPSVTSPSRTFLDSTTKYEYFSHAFPSTECRRTRPPSLFLYRAIAFWGTYVNMSTTDSADSLSVRFSDMVC